MVEEFNIFFKQLLKKSIKSSVHVCIIKVPHTTISISTTLPCKIFAYFTFRVDLTERSDSKSVVDLHPELFDQVGSGIIAKDPDPDMTFLAKNK
jgi:hypothetical protein